MSQPLTKSPDELIAQLAESRDVRGLTASGSPKFRKSLAYRAGCCRSAGRVPFPCTTDKWILLRDVVLKEDPIAPRRLNLAVPVSRETICRKCLEKDRSRH